MGVLDDDSERVYRILKDIEFAKYHVNPEGYMVRISPESCREQVRVSRKALRGGISRTPSAAATSGSIGRTPTS